MPARQRDERQADQAADRQQRSAVIGRNVLRALGQPGDLHRVQVQNVWEDHYPVNVFVGPNAAASKVARSFFVRADGRGAILTADPAITRQY
jgi:hypothetical protein